MRIKRNTFKLITAFASIVGITVIAFSLIYRGFPSESLAISLPDFTITEETEEYEVCSALLEKLFVKDDVKLLVIQKQTISSVDNYFIHLIVEKRTTSMKKHFPSVSEDAFQNFSSKNQQFSNLNSEFVLPVKYVVTDKIKPKNNEDVAWIDSFYENFQMLAA